ncbi:MAG TPA: PfkB family carbohydrate kinase [Actinomycetota bacterium]|nr:PfkB family carbohydrate kinase [Actinomycetota bacterium]
MDLICVGDLMLDVSAESRALARGGDVHGRVRLRPGGSAANAAVWAAASGAETQVIGRVGDDPAGRIVRESIVERGVDAIVSTDRSTPTGTMLVVHAAEERSMVADRGANATFRPEHLPARLEAKAVLVSGYLLLQRETHATARAALERARGQFVAVDAGSWPLVESVGADRFFAWTREANVLFANEREAEALCGEPGEDAAAALAHRYPVVCVKLGSQGAVMSWEGLLIRFSTDPVEGVDPTGAGDAFDGALLAALAQRRSPGEALRIACAAGSVVASSRDTWPKAGPGTRPDGRVDG